MSFFDGKVVIVTGSSNGIGRATARQFAVLGAKVTITGRNPDSLKKTKDECVAAGAKEDNIHEIISDLESDETPNKLVDGTIAKFGQIDVLVNNAGMALADEEGNTNITVPIEHFDRMSRVNLRSIILLVQKATPHLEKTKGAIVNVSSIAGFPFGMQEIYYPITKAGLDQLTVQLAFNLMKKGIRVNSVNPGIVATDIIRKMGVSDEMAQKSFFDMGKNPVMVPLGRCGVPDDIGKLIVFLADRSQSEFIVGQRIVIDGGSLLNNIMLSIELPKPGQ